MEMEKTYKCINKNKIYKIKRALNSLVEINLVGNNNNNNNRNRLIFN